MLSASAGLFHILMDFVRSNKELRRLPLSLTHTHTHNFSLVQILQAHSPDCVGLDPDARVTQWIVRILICVRGVAVGRGRELPNGLIHGHVVGQHAVANQELQAVSHCTLSNEHSRLHIKHSTLL